MRLRSVSLVVAAVLLSEIFAGSLFAQTASTGEAARPTAVLVELFTSEGCSTCPPADDLLRQMEGRLADPGHLIVALSEHVTYWNRLGWADPFSQDVFTDRQNAYAERFNLDSVYTPQTVVDGEHQVAGNDGAAILQAVRSEPVVSPLTVHILSVAPSGKKLTLTFAVSGDAPKKGVDIFAVVADDMVTSEVTRGENKGRTLTHVSVARSFTRVASLKTGSTMTVRIPSAGDGRKPDGGGQHLVVFAQAAGQGKVLSVATAAL